MKYANCMKPAGAGVGGGGGIFLSFHGNGVYTIVYTKQICIFSILARLTMSPLHHVGRPTVPFVSFEPSSLPRASAAVYV